MESVGSVIRDAAGKVDRIVVVSRDVTERKRLDQAVHGSGSEPGSAAAMTGLGLGCPDQRGHFPRVEGDARLQAEIPNRFEEWQRLTHPEDRERAMRTVTDYFEGRSPVYELDTACVTGRKLR
jgi:hypothetical protein